MKSPPHTHTHPLPTSPPILGSKGRFWLGHVSASESSTSLKIKDLILSSHHYLCSDIHVSQVAPPTPPPMPAHTHSRETPTGTHRNFESPKTTRAALRHICRHPLINSPGLNRRTSKVSKTHNYWY